MLDHPLVWTTVRVKISDLKGYDKNPRRITDQGKRDLEDSLSEFNVVEIPTIDMDFTLLTWHQRAEAMVSLGRGEEEIDARMPNRPLTDAEHAKYNLIANRHNGEFDISKLKLNFDPDLLHSVGFKASDLDDILNPEIEQENEPTQDEVTDFKLPEMELKSFEHYDYLVIAFDNVNDFMKALTMFGLEKVNASFVEKTKRPGIGRVIKSGDFFDRVS